MVLTSHKVSREMNRYYYLIEYLPDTVNISYWDKDSTGEFVKSEQNNISINLLNAKEVIDTIKKKIDEVFEEED